LHEWFIVAMVLSARDFPLVLQGNAKSNGKWVTEANSDSQSEDNGDDDKGERKGKGESQDSKVVEATTLGLQTKSGLRPNSRYKASLYMVGGQLPN
jgi:hypothetical protein